MSDPFDALGFVPDEQPAKAEPSMLERVGQTAYDGAVGLGQGLSMDSADELAGAMPGTSIAEQQGIRDQARGRSPIAYDAMHAVGSAGPMLLSGGASALEQLGALMMQGGVGGFMGADGGLQDRSGAGLVGAGTAPVVGAVAGGAAKGLSALEEWAGLLANKLRMNAFSTPGKFATTARQEGLDYTRDELAQAAERHGLTNKIIPQSPESFAKRASAARDAAGAAEGAALDAAGGQGVRGDMRSIQSGLGELRDTAALDPTSDRQAVPPIYDRMISNLEQDIGRSVDTGAELSTPRYYGGRSPWDVSEGPATPDQVRIVGGPQNAEMTPRDIWALKKKYEAKGGYPSDQIKNLPEGLTQTAYQNASDVPREHLQDVMHQATPDIYDQFNTGRGDFSELAALANLANERAIHNDSHSLGALPASIFSGGGAAAGASLGGTVGAAAGAAAGYGMGQANRIYGPDAAANTMRGFEHLAGMGAGGARTVARGAGQLTGQAASERERASNASKGHEMQNAVSRALQSDPSVLGQYAQQFQEAQQDPDPMVMSALISELNDDPQFRATVLPQLQRLSNPQGDY